MNLNDKKPEEVVTQREDENLEAEDEYEDGWEDIVVKNALLLIGENNSDKNTRDNQNRMINEALREAETLQEPEKPRYVATMRLKQAKVKTAARIQPLKWTMQGDGATEEEEILVTKAFQEALHRGNYDSTFTGKNGVVDGVLSYGNKYRMIQTRPNKESSFPVEFVNIDNNNAWMSTKATTFRNGNKNVTKFALVFTGTRRDFEEMLPEYAGKNIPAGFIPKTYQFKDLDQTVSQQFKSGFDLGDKDGQQMEWAYFWDIVRREYVLFAGSSLKVLEKKTVKNYPWVFKNIENKEVVYFPVTNFMCLPSEEGIYDVSLLAYIYGSCATIRKAMNGFINHTFDNMNPHKFVNVPQDQADAFFNLIEMADQMAASGQQAYVPIAYNPNNPGQITSGANPVVNTGDSEVANRLIDRMDDELRKCGVYLDEPLESDLTEQQIALQASNAQTLPKEIMKYNAPEIEFELNVALDLMKKYIKTGDKTSLVLDTTIDLPDGKYSIRSIPFTLGWLKEKLNERDWRFVVDPESGAVTNNNVLISLYKSILPTMDPASPAYAATNEKVALISGVTIPKTNPAAQALVAQGAQGGQPIPTEGGTIPPPPELNTPAPALQEAAGIPQ